MQLVPVRLVVRLVKIVNTVNIVHKTVKAVGFVNNCFAVK